MTLWTAQQTCDFYVYLQTMQTNKNVLLYFGEEDQLL
jgi:hypothetical protein